MRDYFRWGLFLNTLRIALSSAGVLRGSFLFHLRQKVF